jgi:hypothetical protein
MPDYSRERALLARLRELHREQEHSLLTRGQVTEARHTLLYLSHAALQLREYAGSDAMRWTTFRGELEEMRGQLEALAAYVTPGWRGVRWNRNEIGGALGPIGDVCQAQIQAWRREP